MDGLVNFPFYRAIVRMTNSSSTMVHYPGSLLEPSYIIAFKDHVTTNCARECVDTVTELPLYAKRSTEFTVPFYLAELPQTVSVSYRQATLMQRLLNRLPSGLARWLPKVSGQHTASAVIRMPGDSGQDAEQLATRKGH